MKVIDTEENHQRSSREAIRGARRRAMGWGSVTSWARTLSLTERTLRRASVKTDARV